MNLKNVDKFPKCNSCDFSEVDYEYRKDTMRCFWCQADKEKMRMEIKIIWIAKLNNSEIAIESFYDMMEFIEKYPEAEIKSKIFMNKEVFK